MKEQSPTSATNRESSLEKQERMRQEKLEQLRKDIILNFTLAFLSHVNTGNT